MSSEQDFETWRASFRVHAIAQGVTPRVYDFCAAHLRIDPKIHELQSNQSEFVLTISDYVERAVSDQRVRKGRAMFRKWRELITDVSAKFAVDPQVIMAIWGVESNFGKTRGRWPVLTALANLAHAGHRSAFFESELVAALQIIQDGDITPLSMHGSWAGAMGHGQFMPTSYQKFAVDFDGDGQRDIWRVDPTDGVASIANYLASHGWRMGAPWGVEVTLPEGFDFTQAGLTTKKPVQDWTAQGVITAEGTRLADYGVGSVLVPSGASGPAFLVFANFDVLLTYNRAEAYGIAVGHLADRLSGGKALVARCPEGLTPLKRDEMRALQLALTKAGFDTQGADGFSGPNTVAALRAYQLDRGLVPDGFGSSTVLERLRAEIG